MIGSDFIEHYLFKYHLKLQEMSTTRRLPDSNIARRAALNMALQMMTASNGAFNLLSPETSARLLIAAPKYDAAHDAVIAANAAYHLAIGLAKPQRILLRSYVRRYFASLKENIKFGKILKSARALYDLDVTNMRLPDISSDHLLITVAERLIKADALRIAAGGIAITLPTMDEFMVVYNAAKPIINALSTATTTVNTAIQKQTNQQEDVDDLIVHIWDEVEGKYSKSKPAARRVSCRLWGVRYFSKGVESEVTGLCIDSITKQPLPNVQLHIAGAGSKTKSDVDGKYAKNTRLYGDLEIMATLPGYEPLTIDFVKEDGVVKVIDVAMVRAL